MNKLSEDSLNKLFLSAFTRPIEFSNTSYTLDYNSGNTVGAKVLDDKLKIQVVVAGYNKDTLNVEFKDDALHVSADKPVDTLLNLQKLTHTFHIDTLKYDVKKTDVTVLDGVLTIEIPTNPDSLPLKFKIK